MSIDSLNSRCNYLAAFCYFEISKYDQTKSEYGKLALDCIKNSLEIDSDNFLAFSLYGEINNKKFKAAWYWVILIKN